MVPVIKSLHPDGLLRLHLGVNELLGADNTITILIYHFLVIVLWGIWVVILLNWVVFAGD